MEKEKTEEKECESSEKRNNQKTAGEMSVDMGALEHIYTPLEEAKEEIWRRWNNRDLKKRVEDFLGGDVPEVFRDGPRGFLARHIASPTNELERFLSMNDKFEFQKKPILLEYLSDKFTPANLNKYHLGKLIFYCGLEKNGKESVFAKKIVDFDKYQSKPIFTVETFLGENLIDFHHILLNKSGFSEKVCLFDISGWYNRNGGFAKNYYSRLFTLFLCFGVLFENFLRSKNEKKFTETVVLPNFSFVEEYFGYKPLIVPLIPLEKEDDIYFWSYSEEIYSLVSK